MADARGSVGPTKGEAGHEAASTSSFPSCPLAMSATGVVAAKATSSGVAVDVGGVGIEGGCAEPSLPS
jgi:hypothetical protein